MISRTACSTASYIAPYAPAEKRVPERIVHLVGDFPDDSLKGKREFNALLVVSNLPQCRCFELASNNQDSADMASSPIESSLT
jgi:hypothetical protein